MTFIIGINVLHIKDGQGAMCGNEQSLNKNGYELDVIKRIGRVKPLCSNCSRMAIKQINGLIKEG